VQLDAYRLSKKTLYFRNLQRSCPLYVHSLNFTGCQFNGALSSSSYFSYFQGYAYTETPPYPSRLLIPYRLSRVLRSSSSSNLLHVRHTDLIFGSRSLCAAAPTIWNSLLDSVLSSDALKSLQWNLKTPFSSSFKYPHTGKLHRLRFIGTLKHLFQAALSTPIPASSIASDSFM